MLASSAAHGFFHDRQRRISQMSTQRMMSAFNAEPRDYLDSGGLWSARSNGGAIRQSGGRLRVG